MSAWTEKKHDLTRQAASEIAAGRAGDECEWTGLYLGDALDEIERLWANLDELHAEVERLRGLVDDRGAIERAAKALCESLEGVDRYWHLGADETERDWYRRAARITLRAALNPEGGEQT